MAKKQRAKKVARHKKPQRARAYTGGYPDIKIDEEGKPYMLVNGEIVYLNTSGTGGNIKLGTGAVTGTPETEDGSLYVPFKDSKRKAPGSSVWDSFKYPEPASVEDLPTADDLPESLRYVPETTDVNAEEVYSTPVTEMKEPTKVTIPDLGNDADEEDRDGASRGGIRRVALNAGGRRKDPMLIRLEEENEKIRVKEQTKKPPMPEPETKKETKKSTGATPETTLNNILSSVQSTRDPVVAETPETTVNNLVASVQSATDPAVKITGGEMGATQDVKAPQIQSVSSLPSYINTSTAPSAGPAEEASVVTSSAPTTVDTSTYTADTIASADVPTVDAAQGELSEDAVARVDEKELTERAVAARRNRLQEKEALIKEAAQYEISEGAYVDKVTGKVTDVAPTREAEFSERKAILGDAAEDGKAAEILDKVNYEAVKIRKVKGTAAKGEAAEMIAEVGEIPPELSATIVEDPATVEAQIDDEPIEVRAAIAALPTEALVSSQMETLLGGIEDGEVPVWARPAVEQVNRMLEQRGLTASTVGRDALLNSIIQSAMPIAQSNAQALQQRAAQNLSNEQQANVQQANLDAQRRLQNTANRQTAGSQTAQMAQQMSVLQSQFAQDAMITSAAQTQQTKMANLQNQQQAALQRSQNQQAINAQNLGNEQQTELANLQFEFQTDATNMSAENQSRLVEMQTAADFLSKNAGFKQQMELANLSNEQQMELANLTAKNQTESENLTAEQQTRLANLDSRMKTNLLQAEIANRMNVAQLNADQQRAVTNASMVANMDMAQFNADQQVILSNSKFMQSMTMQDLNNRQQAVIQNATAMAQLDMSNLDAQTKLAAQNAQSFLQVDLANLNNKQQAAVLDAQMQQQTLLSNQSMTNAAKQFNAQSQNQVDQFNSSLAAQIDQANVAQKNAMAQFNASEANRQAQADLSASTAVMTTAIGADATVKSAQLRNDSAERIAGAQLTLQAEQFNADQDFRRDQFNTANSNAIAQADIAWRRQVSLAETAAQNAANQQNAQNAFALTMQQQQNAWLVARDEANYLNQQYENEETRKTQLLAVALGNEAAAGQDAKTTTNSMLTMIEQMFNSGTGGG